MMLIADLPKNQEPNNSCAVSVCVCTRNRCTSLLQTLDSLETQRWQASPNCSWEVLVVDNGSDDGSMEAVRQRESSFPTKLRVIAEPEAGLSYARNRALREAKGRAIVFIDDDVTCQDGWLAAHAAAFEIPDVVAAGGPILPSMPSETPDWFRAVLVDEIGGPTSRYDFGDEPAEIVPEGPIPLPFGANMAVLREVAIEAGGFRTDLGWGKKMIPSEELEFFRRIQAQGGRILYSPDASLIHHIEPHRVTMTYYRYWQQGYGRSLVMMTPPNGTLARLSSIISSAWKIIRLIVKRSLTRDDRSYIQVLRDLERKKGSLKQLFGW